MFRFKGNMLIYLYKCVNGCLSILSCFEMLERIIAKRIGGVSGNIALFGSPANAPFPSINRLKVAKRLDLFVGVIPTFMSLSLRLPKFSNTTKYC